MPFTDPMADGPAIQAANLRSLGAGTRTAIQKEQLRLGLPADGWPTRELLDAL